uniref:Calmodulin-lysine N-methyltransferase n=1 Tax=Amorphochlora amoebiformis TaxID=1561963 RepID=A0A7S0CPN0_9EUKA|mmetsp:Transcript_11397/g.18000  ORF Transcript_11397/g.18000 Transcript_11397/m.18000 type:complete len:379 (+) Transcript_11397:73-1209(+)
MKQKSVVVRVQGPRGTMRVNASPDDTIDMLRHQVERRIARRMEDTYLGSGTRVRARVPSVDEKDEDIYLVRERMRGDGVQPSDAYLKPSDTLAEAGISHGSLIYWTNIPGTQAAKTNPKHVLSVYRYSFGNNIDIDLQHRPPGTFTFDSGESLWGGSRLLCEYILQKMRDRWKKCPPESTIELGAGIGLVSILASRCGLRKVVSTDGNPKVMSVLMANISKNKVESKEGAVSSLRLRWGNQNDIKSAIHHAFASRKGFQLVLASNTLYTELSIDPFFSTVRDILNSKGELLLSRSLRKPSIEQRIRKSAKSNGLKLVSSIQGKELEIIAAKSVQNSRLLTQTQTPVKTSTTTTTVGYPLHATEVSASGYVIERYRSII